ASNPRKFSEKIALHTQRQAEETAAFQEVMMDITSTRLQAQNLRLARSQGPYYSGSLPNVNQIGRNAPDFQVSGERGGDLWEGPVRTHQFLMSPPGLLSVHAGVQQGHPAPRTGGAGPAGAPLPLAGPTVPQPTGILHRRPQPDP
ncbi:unnamed protein product, partial [Tetraodon nigroviridis]